jgi:hypothetical protein
VDIIGGTFAVFLILVFMLIIFTTLFKVDSTKEQRRSNGIASAFGLLIIFVCFRYLSYLF